MYDYRRSKFNEEARKLKQFYAAAFLGFAMTAWTMLAIYFMYLAIVSLVIMLVEKRKCDKAEKEYDKKREMYDRMNVDGIDTPDDGVYGKEEVLTSKKRTKK